MFNLSSQIHLNLEGTPLKQYKIFYSEMQFPMNFDKPPNIQ